MSQERIQYNDDKLDEIVAENVTVHLEAMDAHRWMLRIYRAPLEVFVGTKAALNDGGWASEVDVHLSVYDVFEVEDPRGLPVKDQGPLAVCHQWTTRDGRSHYCTGNRTGGPHKRHHCDCGSWRPA